MAKGYGERYNSDFPGKQGMDFRSQVRQERGPDLKPKAFTKESQEFIKAEQLVHETVNKLKQRYPEKSQREIATIARKELPAWLWKFLPIASLLSLIMAACATAAPTPSPEVPNTSQSPATEVAGATSGAATEVATEVVEVATNNPLFNYLASQPGLSEETISSNPAFQNDLFDKLIEKAKSVPKFCLPKAEKWQTTGTIDVISNDIFVTPDGVCVAKSADGDQFTTSIEDENGFLIIFKSTLLQKANLKEGDLDFITPDSGMLATLRNLDGSSTGHGISRITRQATTTEGVLAEQAQASVVSTPTAINSEQQSNGSSEETAYSETMAELVAETKETGIWPTFTTENQKEDFFEEFNNQRGPEPLAFPDPSDPNSILVYVPTELYPNFAEEFKDVITGRGNIAAAENLLQYGDEHRTFKLPKDFFTRDDRGKEAAEKLTTDKWVQMDFEKDAQGNRTGNLMFRDPLSNQWMVIPGSKSLSETDWQTPITKNTLDQAITDGKFAIPKPKSNDSSANLLESMEGSNPGELLPLVLLPLPAEGEPRLPVAPDYNINIDATEMLQVRWVTDEAGQKIPIGEKVHVGSWSVGGGMYILVGDSSKFLLTRTGEAFRNPKIIDGSFVNEGGIYYALISKNPKASYSGSPNFDRLSKSSSFSDPAESYFTATTLEAVKFLAEEKLNIFIPKNSTSMLIVVDELAK